MISWLKMFYIISSKMNKHYINGAQYDTKLYPVYDILEFSQRKI